MNEGVKDYRVGARNLNLGHPRDFIVFPPSLFWPTLRHLPCRFLAVKIYTDMEREEGGLRQKWLPRIEYCRRQFSHPLVDILSALLLKERNRLLALVFSGHLDFFAIKKFEVGQWDMIPVLLSSMRVLFDLPRILFYVSSPEITRTLCGGVHGQI